MKTPVHTTNARDTATGAYAVPPGAVRRTFSPPPPVDIGNTLAPLVQRLKAYDQLLTTIRSEGGRLAQIRTLTGMLRNPVELQGYARRWEVALAEPQELKSAIADAAGFMVVLQVRETEGKWPAYLLCRIRRDYWSQYGLVVEEYYRSPRYPALDSRFVTLMDAGREHQFLSMSPFRAASRKLLERTGTEIRDLTVDDLLFRVGSQVLQAAWHEDQRPAIVTADHLKLPSFRAAVELLYLCLSGELCDLRSQIDPDMLAFFEHALPHPPIYQFLDRLTELDGYALNSIPQDALRHYAALSTTFAAFLNREIEWGNDAGTMMIPLYKIIFANFKHLDTIAPALRANRAVTTAAGELEQHAADIINALS